VGALLFKDHISHLRAIRRAALRAADPAQAVERHLRLSRSALHAGPHRIPLEPSARIWLVGLGKAAPAMSAAAAEILGGRLSAGVVTVPKHGTQAPSDPLLRHEGRAEAASMSRSRTQGEREAASGPAPPGVQFIQSEHPTPGPGSLRAAHAAATMLAQARDGDLLLALISGGGSALIELPLPGVRLSDLQALTRQLLASGAAIGEINRVRRALSQIKAGGLARLAAARSNCISWELRSISWLSRSTIGSVLPSRKRHRSAIIAR